MEGAAFQVTMCVRCVGCVLCVLCAIGGLPIAFSQDAPAEAIRLNNLGVAFLTQARINEALDSFRQARQRQPSLLTARLNEGIALIQAQRLTDARDALLDVTRQQPQNLRAWYNLGLAYRTLGEGDSAIDAFERVSRIDPNDADALYFLGQLHSQAGRHEQAIAFFLKCLSLDARHVSAEFGLARAYQLSGNVTAAAQHLARFDELSKSKLGKPISAVYGEQGPYSTAEPIAGDDPAPSDFAVRLIVDTRAGLRPDFEPRTMNGVLAQFGSGACFTDFDADGRPDLLLLSGSRHAMLYRNAGGRFTDVTARAGLNVTQNAFGCAAGDYDNDGRDDLAIGLADGIALYRNQGNGTFRDTTSTLGIRGSGMVLGVSFVDYDHDGDLDLYVPRFRAPGSSNQVWRNNGNGTFTDATAQAGLAGDAAGIGVVAADLDNDRAIDLVLTGWQRPPLILRNPRDGAFQPRASWSQSPPSPAIGAVAADFNKDGWMDLAFTHSSSPAVTLWKNAGGTRFERLALPELPWDRGWGIAAVDIDNDGWLDLTAVGDGADAAVGELRVLRNLGGERFGDVTGGAVAPATFWGPRALMAGDTDGDGDVDLFITQKEGPPMLLRNDGGNRRASVRLAFRGLADNRSGIGTKVEVFAGALRQKFELQSSSGYLGQNAPGILAGIDGWRQADIVRLLWPTGVVQDEVQLATGRRHLVNEIDRRGSSCPVVFAWNGERYEFVADMIGPGIVGHWVAPGERNIPDPTEYLKVDGSRIRARNGRLSFRFAEVMEELTYLDHVRLMAVDHPAEVTVHPNEYFASQPPFPEFKVIQSRNARLPVAARDDSGRNVLPMLQDRDRRYVTGFDPIQFGGFAKLHYLELDLGTSYAGGQLRLLMQGFIEYFTATSVFAAHQAGIQAIVPFIDVQAPDGRWVRAIDDIGFPAGLARTSVADLTGRLPAGTSRIRIGTNLKIYWDQVLIDATPQAGDVELHEVPLMEASLRFLGFPRQLEGNPPSDLSYDYNQVSATGPFTRHSGYYTAYGDVRTIVGAADERFAILGSGDEVALEFDATALPPLRPGWTRDYFFYADGFAKDMDFYEALSGTVEPLPFHSMGQYPYGPQTRYPNGPLHQDYRLNTNTRSISGGEMRSFRFRYP